MELAHNFLLAMPGLTGDYFADSLTYICEHNEDGAMGLIVNRPSEVSLVELFAQLGLASNHDLVDTPVMEGGPVALERGFVLHAGDRTFESSHQLADDLYLSTAIDVLDAIVQSEGPENYLVTLGYAGWGAGQLEDEMSRNVWLSAPADTKVLFNTPFAERLNVAANTLGIDFSLIAGRPGHA